MKGDSIKEPEKFPVAMFFYGILRHGLRAHPNSKFLETVKTKPYFKMYAVSYPWIVEGGNTSVVGDLFEINEEDFKSFNRMEIGAGYSLTVIDLEDGREALGYVFPDEELLFLRGRVPHLVENGDYLEWLATH